MEKNRHVTNGGFQMSVSTRFKYLGINISLSKFSEIYLNEILKRQTQFPKLVGPFIIHAILLEFRANLIFACLLKCVHQILYDRNIFCNG